MRTIKMNFEIFIIKLTHKLWNRHIFRILSRAYENRIIDSKIFHTLHAAFDPTQDHQLYGEGKIFGFRKEDN